MVGRNEEHAGCKCPIGYEGTYCQFVVGSRPSDWTLSDSMHPALINAYGSSSSNGMGAGGIIGMVLGVCVGVVLLFGILAGYLYCGSLGSVIRRRDGKEMAATAASSNDEDDITTQQQTGVVLGGRRTSTTSPQNASFVGGKSVYKKKTSTGHFVTADTLEADGAVLTEALDDLQSTSMDEVDLADDAPVANGQMA